MNLTRQSLTLGCILGFAGCAQGGFGGSPGALDHSALSMLPNPPAGGSPAGRMHRRSGSAGPEIYVFQGQPDASAPQVGLANIGDTLYGTTYYGGANNEGAVYSVTTGGAETVMHSFPTGSNDGYYPDAALTAVGGTLYGTTYNGGVHGTGTIFSITPSGSYKVLYSFDSRSSDCESPDSTLTYVKSKKALYGVAYHGGADGEGCIFKWSLGKKPAESILYSFTGSASSPTYASAVVFYKNAFYGTTPEGGVNDYGSVFKVTLKGKESLVYSFKDEPDGANPYAGLVVDGNALYGTTTDGGQGACGGYAGCGVVFKLTPAGKETVLYRFTDVVSKIDGGDPQSALVVVGGMLYGTAPCTGEGCGSSVLFALNPSGKGGDTIVYDFTSTPSSPSGYPLNAFLGSPLSLNGKFYGTSSGSVRTGYGTVWAVPQ
jgi:uncharacterized repeat protein (TIGR03803 family)